MPCDSVDLDESETVTAGDNADGGEFSLVPPVGELDEPAGIEFV